MIRAPHASNRLPLAAGGPPPGSKHPPPQTPDSRHQLATQGMTGVCRDSNRVQAPVAAIRGTTR